MILVDTSVWIELFAKRNEPVHAAFERALRDGPPVSGDIINVELLQGFRDGTRLKLAEATLAAFRTVALCSPALAPIAAANYRTLRGRGITVRGTVDVIIATWCIENGVALLHNDRDFIVMERELGLVGWPV